MRMLSNGLGGIHEISLSFLLTREQHFSRGIRYRVIDIEVSTGLYLP
jgi:hypothetical protein